MLFPLELCPSQHFVTIDLYSSHMSYRRWYKHSVVIIEGEKWIFSIVFYLHSTVLYFIYMYCGMSSTKDSRVQEPSYMRWYKHSVVIIDGEKWVFSIVFNLHVLYVIYCDYWILHVIYCELSSLTLHIHINACDTFTSARHSVIIIIIQPIYISWSVALYPRCSSVSVFPSAESRISYDARLLSKDFWFQNGFRL